MPLKRMFLDVYLDAPDTPDGYTEHRVEVRGVDQLRAELEGKRRSLVVKDAIHTTFLWAWASLTRTGDYAGSFDEFKVAAIQVNGVKDDDLDDDAGVVDPTQPAASAG